MILKNTLRLAGLLILGLSLAGAQGQGSAGRKAPAKKGDPAAHAGQGEDVRGTMSLSEISQKTGVPLAHFLKALKLDKSAEVNKPVRDWIHSKGMTMQDVRAAAKTYKAPGK